ncbi:hypothetical protein PUR28_31570 [Streptomyces sp. BE308]|uniref:hypothetical protein n=1 Tax=Streptomyces sp. BE308 TaxID=3002529 RepID=UPI002E77BD40|nr:hypothetical protein [Streptomyces sp. BE308]MEE1795263.1 hypothetical protein [Streptomyces sp. BE308]
MRRVGIIQVPADDARLLGRDESVAPGDAGAHFGFVGSFFASAMTASDHATRQLLAWEPSGPSLLADIDAGACTG